MKDGAGNK
jgi:hypothetical protein